MIKRQTIQCDLVREAVNTLGSHATADEIYEEVQKTHPHIGRGTVYRNLQKLCEEGKIRKVQVPEGADRYDHICRNHYHIRCVKCGKVFDVDMPYIENLEETAKDLLGFTSVSHDIIFKGICPACQNKT